MDKHTPEPWHRNVSARYPIYAEQTPGKKDWRHIAGVLGNDEQAEADLRRIVACVNACAGIPTEALEAGELRHALLVMRDAQLSLSKLDNKEGAYRLTCKRQLEASLKVLQVPAWEDEL